MTYKRNVVSLVSIAVLTTALYAGADYILTKNHLVPEAEVLEAVPDDMVSDESEAKSALFSPELEKDMAEKYKRAYAKNSDIIGWIFVPDSNVDYPICSGNNNYYLNYTSEKEPSAAGSIFLDENQITFNDVSLIHGHNMKNGTMFSTLKKFKNEDFFNSHNVYIYDGTTVRVFKAIGFTRVGADSTFNLNVSGDAQIREYAEQLTSKSIHPRPDSFSGNPLLILNTCVSDGSNDHFIVTTQEVK